jgi:HK97 family phage major capsid protein
MKKSLELKEKRSELVNELEAIHDVAKTEKRDLTKSETLNVDKVLSNIDNLDTDIERAEKVEAQLRSNAKLAGASVSTPKADKRYSIQKAINGYMNNDLSGLEKEYDQEARRNNTITGVGIPLFAMGETRAAQTTSNASGLIPTEVGAFAETLQNKTVLGDLSTWMYGLTGDMKLPTLSGTTAGFGTEVANAPDASTSINSETLQPRKLSAHMDISKMLLQQTNGSVENIIRNDIQNAIASVLESAVLGNEDGTGAIPKGVFQAGTNAAAGVATRPNVIELIKKLEEGNADGGRTAFCLTPGAKSVLQNLPADVVSTSGASTPLFSMDNKIMGIDAKVTNNVAIAAGVGEGLVVGMWDDCVIGQFGNALDVVVDPFTKAISGEVRLVVLSYWDVIFRRANSFQYRFIEV